MRSRRRVARLLALVVAISALSGATAGGTASTSGGTDVSAFPSHEADKYPSLAFDGQGGLWVAYVESRDKRDTVVVRRRRAGGEVAAGARDGRAGRNDEREGESVSDPRDSDWSPPRRLSSQSGVESHPRLLTLPDGGLLVVWHARRDGKWGLYGRRLSAGAIADGDWTPEHRIETAGVEPLHPRLCRDGEGTLWLAFEALRDGRLQVALMAGTVGDETRSSRPPEAEALRWSEPAVVHPAGRDRRPALACRPEGGAWVAWDSDRTGNYDVFLTDATLERSSDGQRTGMTAVEGPESPESASPSSVVVDDLLQVTAHAAFDDTPSLAVDPDNGDLWIAWNTMRTHVDGVLRTDRHLSDAMVRVHRDGRWLTPPGTVPEASPGQVSFGAANKTPHNVVDPYWHWKQTQNYPRLHFDAGGRLWVAWRTDATGAHDFDLWARVWDSGTWSPELHLTTPYPGRDEWPSFANGPAHRPEDLQSGDRGTSDDTGDDTWIAWEGQRRPEDESLLGRGDVDVFNTRDAPTNVFVGRLQKLVPSPDREDRSAWTPAPLRPAPEEVHDPDEADEPAIPGPEAGGVEASSGPYRIFFGDPHSHSVLSDGKVGWPDQILTLARDPYGLDFAAVTDHAEMGRLLRSEYAELQLYARAFTEPGRFVSFTGFEWTAGSAFGHRVTLYRQDDAPHFGINEAATDDIHELYDRVHRHGGLMSPHHTGHAQWGRWNPEHHDPRLERNFEIASWHGRFEYYGNPWEGRRQVPGHQFQDALRRGYRMGVMGGSDTHHLLPGEGGLTAILAEALDREHLFEAVRARRIYATTGEKIVLEFTANGEPMGSELAGTDAVRMGIRVRGTDAIDSVEVVKDLIDTFAVVRLEEDPTGRSGAFYVYAPTGERREEVADTRIVDVEFRDTLADDAIHSYYVRVTQADGEQAWSSPIWVTRRAAMPPEPRGTHRHEAPKREPADRGGDDETAR